MAEGREAMSGALVPRFASEDQRSRFASEDVVQDLMSVRAQKKKPWEFQCDHEDDAIGAARPVLPVSKAQLPAPWEDDKLVDLWALSLEGETARVGRWSFVEALWFQSMVGAVIFMNAIIIGLETDNDSPYWAFVEQFLLIFFVVELTLRMAYYGIENFLKQYGNIFDLVIVLSGVFDMWFMPIYHISAGSQTKDRSGLMSALQMLRLLRIVRLVRLVKIVQPLYRLALGIAEALQGMFWVLVFLVMMLYAVAIVLTRLLGRDVRDAVTPAQELAAWGVSNVPAERAELTKSMFHSVPSSMFVLFESMSCWSLVQFTPLFIVFPVMKLLAVLFYIFSVWALLAVMTGLVSDKMIAVRAVLISEEKNSTDDKENKKEEMKALVELFNRADVDGSGEISKEEFTAMLMWTDISKHLVTHLGVNNQDLNQLFDWLDKDKDGVIDTHEFVDGLFWLNDNITPKSLLKLQEEMASVIRELQARLEDHANKRFDALINAVSRPLGKIHAVTEQIQRLDAQLSTKQGAARSDTTVRNDRIHRGPTTRQELAKMERRLTRQIDTLLSKVETLGQLQKQGLVHMRTD